MQSDSDWRRSGQESYLQGVTLVRQKYGQYAKNPEWDHDHCTFCCAKFMVGGKAGALDRGYSTKDEYHWVCQTCFDDFHEEFEWKLNSEGDLN